jgi:NhaA family Na+:H+ antiporter
MLEKITKPILHPIRELAESGKLGGVLLIIATAVSMYVTNSKNAESYLHFWHQEIGNSFISMSLGHWINDLLMAIFFFLVGLEIKRELAIGELSSPKKIMLPLMAALGGMLMPAIIFFLFNNGTEHIHGWAIPTATDIAFSLGVLSLLGKRVPLSLKIFLTALAIIDDLGGIVIIAVFYTKEIFSIYLLYAGAVMVLLFIMTSLKIQKFIFYLIPVLCLWFFIYKSGIHATIAGVLAALFVPIERVEKYEHILHKPVNYLILPLFALVNTTIPLSNESIQHVFSNLSLGIIIALLIGKSFGITLFTYISVKTKIGELQDNSDIKDIFGVSMLAGIGFTMSLFFTTLSFNDVDSANTAKLAIIIGSTLSAIFGLIFLSLTLDKEAINT